MTLHLQVDVQQHTQVLQLVGQEPTAGSGAAQLLVAHVDLALHGLNVVIVAFGFLSFPLQTQLENGMEE